MGWGLGQENRMFKKQSPLSLFWGTWMGWQWKMRACSCGLWAGVAEAEGHPSSLALSLGLISKNWGSLLPFRTGQSLKTTLHPTVLAALHVGSHFRWPLLGSLLDPQVQVSCLSWVLP